MRLKIKRMHLTNFKGCVDKEIRFEGDSRIIGENGAGKSTIASGVSWVMADTDYNLVKNPNVVPLGKSECEIRVEVEFSADGKPLEVCKTQKYKEKTDDSGKVTSSIVNSYSINGITKSYKDFVVDLNSRGIDMDNYLIYTNPNCFLADTSKAGREKIRKILFEMASDVSDIDIAIDIGASDVTKIMNEKGFSLEEVKASAKSTYKRIVDNNGKNNEIINSKIDGMISSKSNLDVSVLESQKKEYEAEIERIETEISNSINGKSDLMKKLSDARMERDRLVYEANNKLFKQKTELESAYQELRREISDKNNVANNVNDEIIRAEKVLEEANVDLEKQRELYKMAQDTVFDESDTICPTCKRELPKDEIEHLKAVFDKEKADRIKTLKASGKALNERIRALESEINDLKDRRAEFQRGIEDAESKLEVFEAEINKVPSEADMSENETYQNVIKTISKLEAEVPQDNEERVAELKSQRNMNKAMLNQVIAELGAVEHDKEIDAKVEALREQRRNDEIAKADAEKILSQVSDIEMAKNEKLAESINKNFDLVSWRLWDRQKNGTLIEVTEPYIDGKPMTSCANGSLVTLAKLSICNALQKAREQRMPIWCDDASLFSKNTIDRIKLDTQFIQLIVADDAKEIYVERG